MKKIFLPLCSLGALVLELGVWGSGAWASVWRDSVPGMVFSSACCCLLPLSLPRFCTRGRGSRCWAERGGGAGGKVWGQVTCG